MLLAVCWVVFSRLAPKYLGLVELGQNPLVGQHVGVLNLHSLVHVDLDTIPGCSQKTGRE